MQLPSSFQIYNASAGSGKTFTLVKEYLKILLSTDDIYAFQHVLAITFTNKAATEMKERVLKNLKSFCSGESSDILTQLQKETSLELSLIQKRSKRVLHAILQNYSVFSITTIDAFTHKVIRSFAYDLGLSQNFEVEMDTKELLEESIDLVIADIGVNKEVTDLLVSYSMSKLDEGTSWDIAYNMSEFSSVLFKEDDIEHLKLLSGKSIEEFEKVRKKLSKKKSEIEEIFRKSGEKGLEFINAKGLNDSDFSYQGELPKHFRKLKNLEIETLNFSGRIDKNFNQNKSFSAGKASLEVKTSIDNIYEELRTKYLEGKSLYEKYFGNYILVVNALKSIVPLAVLNDINKQLRNILEENNIRLNSEFNKLISEEIKNQPAPYIYERIGQKFSHYFIDEMQDTSVLQWQNLLPLVQNSLSEEGTGLLLVGDTKQSIYRWRGSNPEQFLELTNSEKSNSFPVQPEVKKLDTNYRSFDTIVDFNNRFFKHISHFFKEPKYKDLFLETSQQELNGKKGGFVSVTFLEKQTDKEENQLKYAKKSFEIIEDCNKQFGFNEIAILVRDKKEGAIIAQYLTENAIPVVSSDSLLLTNSEKVQLIVNVFDYLVNESEEVKFDIVQFVYEYFDIQKNQHQFFSDFIDLSTIDFFDALKEINIHLDINKVSSLSLFEKTEAIVKAFQLQKEPDSYVQFFLDEVLNRQRKSEGLSEFLEYWSFKKDKLSIASPENIDAVQIMTIHKSKGLEFPVVVFPCNQDIYRTQKEKIWLNDLNNQADSFNELLLSYNKDFENINERAKFLHNEKQNEIQLDSNNLLYVALTRSVEQLYVLTEKTKAKDEPTNYSGLYESYLKTTENWIDNREEFSFGSKDRVSEKENIVTNTTSFDYINNPWQNHQLTLLSSSSKLWEKEEAISYGNLIHEMMSFIYTKDDVDTVLEDYLKKGIINPDNIIGIKTKLESVVTHPEISEYFQSEFKSMNEREILDVDNQVIIPDKLVFISDDEVVLIDYKTGKPSKSYHQQLLRYEKVLERLKLKVKKKVLVYMNDEVIVEEI